MDKGTEPPILLRYFKIIRKRLRFILTVMITMGLVVGLYTFLGERTYTARATFLTSVVASPVPTALSTLRLVSGAGSGISPDVIYHLVKSNRMADGVVTQFRGDPRFEVAKNLTHKRVNRMIDSFEVTQGALMGIDATTPDPEFSKEVTNFCVSYLNVINEQMDLTTDKPMVKILDAAETPRAPNSRGTFQKSAAAALIGGLFICFLFILIDYIQHLKQYERRFQAAGVFEESFVTKEERRREKESELPV